MLADEKTVAFIARYRKEVTGGLDEEKIRVISDAYNYGVNLSKRKADVIRLIEEKGLLTDELRDEILKSTKLIEVEDLYRPFKEKKKTKASEAIALGLDGLADIMMKNWQKGSREEFIKPFINDKVPTEEKARLLFSYDDIGRLKSFKNETEDLTGPFTEITYNSSNDIPLKILLSNDL